jgi:hypothetical protein
MCTFFQVTEESAADPKKSIPFRGLRQGLHPYQALGVLEMLLQEVGPVHGGILGDRMGFGKVDYQNSTRLIFLEHC